MENIVPVLPGSRLEQARSRLGLNGLKTPRSHIKITITLQRNDGSLLISFIVRSRFLPGLSSHIHGPFVYHTMNCA